MTTDVKALHHEAMELADEGDLRRRSKDHRGAAEAFAKAFHREREAAYATDDEPSRSILHRSAAWLALEAQLPREAEIVAARGLASMEVGEDLADELRAVLDEAQLRIHAPATPPPGAASIFQVALKGGQVGFGTVDPREAQSRIEFCQRIIHRTVERKNGLPFRKQGSVPQRIVEQTKPRLSAAAGSFVMRFELGGVDVGFWDRSAEVVNELVECFDLLAKGEHDELERRIPDDNYRENFVAMARKVGPDGTRVERVAISGTTVGISRTLVIGRVLAPPRESAQALAEQQQVVGELRAADGTGGKRTITIVPSSGVAVPLRVGEAVLEDIVRPYFGRRVRVTYVKTGKRSARMVGSPEIVDE